MGKPGAKKMDQIVSVTPGDVHIIMIPSPGGPVPTPIPHPCASMIKDKVATKVKVMGQPGAVKGSKSKHTPPHIPMGPGPFQKPPKNEGEIITGSSSVFYEGKEAAMLGDTGQMCSDPSDTPVGKVIGTAAMVLVGGGSSGGDAERAQASANAMKAAAAACHKWIAANMPPGADREKAHRDVCTATGHPVDVATGKLFAAYTDVQLPGRIPLRFSRNYSSARHDVGVFGYGWRHAFECELILHDEFIAHRDENGRFTEFPPIGSGETAWNASGGLGVERGPDGYRIVNADGIIQHFAHPRQGPGWIFTLPLVRVSDRYGNGIRLEWDGSRLKSVGDDAGRALILEYDAAGFVCALLLALPGAAQVETLWRYSYSDGGELLACFDSVGKAYRFEYDNHLLVRETDRNGDSYFFAYDQEGWCVKTWGDGGHFFRQLTYDRQRHRTLVTDSLGFVRLHEWTPEGVVISETDYEGNEWRFGYDDGFRRIREEDPLGNIWSKKFDDKGRLIAAEDGEGNGEEYEWDNFGRLAKYVSKNGQQWLRRYSSDGREAVYLDPLGQETLEIRDERGDLVCVRLPDGVESRFAYDASGRLTSIQTPEGLRIVRRYDAYGHLVEESDGYGTRIRLEYDSLGRLSRVLYGERRQTAYERDAEGRIRRLCDGQGRWTEYTYLPFVDKVQSITVFDAEVPERRHILQCRRLEYDTEHRVLLADLGNGALAKYSYADHRSPVRIEYADGRVQRYEFDARNYISKLFENEELVYEQESNSAGRVTRRRTADGQEYVFEYDAIGKLVKASGGEGISPVEFERDAIGRLLVERGEWGEQTFTYDAGGAEVAYAWNEELQLSFGLTSKTEGRLWTMGRDGHEELRLEYDRRIRLRRVKFATGQEQEFSYEADRRPVLRHIAHRGSTMRTDQFTYDVEGLITGVKTEHGPQRRFRRDALDRLTSMRVIDNGESAEYHYGFGAAGDRVSATDCNGRSYSEEYSRGHRLQRSGDRRFEYDRRGRVVAIGSGEGRTELMWDALNRLKSVGKPNGERIEMRYDALGRRVEKFGPQGGSRFSWLDQRLVHESDALGNERHYLYHRKSCSPLARYLRQTPGGNWKLEAFVNDPNGAPSQVINADGRVVWEQLNMPWGEKRNGDGQPIGLPGQYFDQETGLFYNNARYYCAEACTYLSPDPLGLAGGDSTYAYVSDPLSFIDPLGLAFERPYTRDEVRDTLDASEGRPSPTTGEDGHPRGTHVDRTNQQMRDRVNDPDEPARTSTFEGSQAQDRAATDAINSPAGQARLAELDANPAQNRVVIRAATGPETIRQAREGQGYFVRKTSRETVVVIDVLDRTPGAERIHIQTCYGT
jgi:RHS repeat-associated protein